MLVPRQVRVIGVRLIAVLGVLAFVISGCAPASAPKAEAPPAAPAETGPQRGGTLVVALQAEPETLDTHQTVSLNAARVNRRPIFESLVAYKPDSMELEPLLAERWEVSEDGLVYTFYLRRGVKFHDGTDFDAEAVLFNFERQTNPDNPYYALGTWPDAKRMLAPVERVEVADKYTVRFHLKYRFAPFLHNLVAASAHIVSPAAVKKYGEDFGRNPVGTGPFKFVRWERGREIVLERFDDYWGHVPYLDRVIFRPIPEEATRLSELLSHGVHMATEITPITAKRLRESPEHEVGQALSGAVWFLAMNVTHPPLDDVRVRRAIAHAIDKETIVKKILDDTVMVAESPLSPAYLEYNPNVPRYPYDPKRAKELLAEAGYPDGFELVFRVPVSGSGMLLPVEMGTFIMENLAAVGIKTKIELTEFGTWMDLIRSPKNELTEMSWNVPPANPYRLFTIVTKAGFPPGFNTSYYTNPEVEELVTQAVVELNQQKANELWGRAQAIVMEDVPIVPVCHRLDLTGLSRKVKGFKPHSDFLLRLEQVWLSDL